MPTEPPSEDEAPKRTRRAPAAKKAVPKKATPAVKKAARKATLPKQAAPETPAEPAAAAAGQEPGGTDAVTVETPGPAPARRTRTTKSANTPTATEASTAATDATAVTRTTLDPAATAATPITTTATTPATAAAEATQVTPATLAPAATSAPTATGVAATAETARRDSSTTATPTPETPASAGDPANPAAVAGDQAPAVDRTAADESRKTEPPVLDPPEEAQPHDNTENLPATVEHAARTQEKGWRAVGPQLRDHPGFAPELLALAAVDALGPRARDWVAQVRRAYPEADADGVARLATRRFVRMAGTGGALAAGAGMFAPVAELAAVLWTQANLVLHLAAAYGRDPAHPDRAAELLVLTLVHPDDGTARAALAAALAADVPADGPWGRAAQAAWRLATPVAAQAGGWLGLRLAARRLPGAAALAAAIGGTATAERVAARAVARYRPGRT
ncbi:hypothetical protein [Micromonospora sp. B006]|uniref:hypothetical protein n=1 Tax=Micromonospora sp. B006 TaxID=2201999 RepID=UPI001CEF6133|nr:hypothetical protein [Micromonospora sp. B006]